MSQYNDKLEKWCQALNQYHLPRWEDLPDIDLYMDQVVTFIEKHVFLLSSPSDKLITPAMINNYVKLGLMPKPEKKRYCRTHLAYLIAITLLKQVLTITEVKDGILLQSNINGTRAAYNLFGEELEAALQHIASIALLNPNPQLRTDINLTKENLAVKMVCHAFAYKSLTEKILSIRQPELQALSEVTHKQEE